CYGANPRLLPLSKNKEITIEQTIKRVSEGHYLQWVNACIAGYGKNELSSSFDYAGPFTEAILLGALAVQAYQMTDRKDHYHEGRKKLLWDAKNMKVTNLDIANQFVKREYRKGWEINKW
ncbi:MAG: gfo/Idh/MocA family oxidoreductase, partial [Flavisolibacter sp.]|nr:gfo/Idh/MocA family oxidoreductase [Flavisolibacter sp.]